MPVLVQKFGGTSVASLEQRQRVADKIIKAKMAGYSLVVVVSAMGRAGAPYATDSLINLVRETGGEISPREMDLLMACGEIISGIVLVGTMLSKGYNAVCLTGAQAGIITDRRHGDARIIRVEPKQLKDLLAEGKIVVVTGFQGVSEAGHLTTLGRGGSDTTAAALGVALDAEAVEIYTDVEGIKTADPKIVLGARTLDTVTYNEICQLAYEGAKVIHPRAVEIAMQKNIPLKIKSTFSDHPGTLVTSSGSCMEKGVAIENDRLIAGITQIGNITQLRIELPHNEAEANLPLKIFKAMALADISVDFINVSPEAVMFTVKDEMSSRALEILRNMSVEAHARPGCAKVAAVGAGMTGIPGVMASIVEALSQENIEILQSADSYTTIWCLVRKEDMEKAVRALHSKFLSEISVVKPF
ncbi:MAG: aspartate kinase [Bacillota bacterium]